MMILWVLAPYRVAGRCQIFGETHRLNIEGAEGECFFRNLGIYFQMYTEPKTRTPSPFYKYCYFKISVGQSVKTTSFEGKCQF